MAAVIRGMAEVDVVLEGCERELLVLDPDEEAGTDVAPGLDPDQAREPGPEPGPARPRRTLASDLRGLVGTPARRGRLAVALAVLGVVVAGPLLARAGVSEARVEVRVQSAQRAAAAEARAEVEAAEEVAIAEEAAAAERAAQARAAHNEQRRLLAGLGLNEQTIDAFLLEVGANAELVEYRRDATSATVDRQAAEIPQMQECVSGALPAINAAWNAATFGQHVPVPAPSELCRALLAAGT